MLFVEPQPTSLDLKFTLFRFPVRVHPLFWVVTLILGGSDLNRPNALAVLFLWVMCVFVSILVHELGHAFAFRSFGYRAKVWLYSFGGLAIPDHAQPTPRQQIVISLAGPGAGFLLCAFVVLSHRSMQWAETSELTAEVYWQLWFINLFWGLVNLLPVYPLDGGQVCRAVCVLARARRPELLSAQISFGTALALTILAVMNFLGQPRDLLDQLPWWLRIFGMGSVFPALLFGVLAYSSYQAMDQLRRQGAYWDDDTPPWRR